MNYSSNNNQRNNNNDDQNVNLKQTPTKSGYYSQNSRTNIDK